MKRDLEFLDILDNLDEAHLEKFKIERMGNIRDFRGISIIHAIISIIFG